MKRWAFTLLLACSIQAAFVGVDFARAKDHPFSDAYVRDIRQTFFDGNSLSPEKVAAQRALVTKRRLQVFENLVVLEQQKGKSAKKARAKANSSDDVRAYDLALQTLDEMSPSLSDAELLKKANLVLILEYATVRNGPEGAIKTIGDMSINTMKSWKFNFSKNKHEASDLYDPNHARYYDESELSRMAATSDLSLLDPGPDSTVWHRPEQSISTLDPEQRLLCDQGPMTDGINYEFPESVVRFEEVKQVGTTPKLEVSYPTSDGKTMKAKLKFGAEINSDPTVTSLMATLGYSTPPSKHFRNMLLNTGSLTISDFRREVMNHYRPENLMRPFDVNDYIEDAGTNRDGDHLIRFKEGYIEPHPKELLRLGPWSLEDNNYSNLREVRGLEVFNLWIANFDVRGDGSNNKLILKDDGNSQKILSVQSDSSGALGGIIQEKLDFFPWDFAKMTKSDVLAFNFVATYPNLYKDKMTLADVRWAARLIGQLTRPQIEAAVRLGEWPPQVGALLTEKLISRRNQMVEAVGLSSELPSLPISRNLTLSDGSVVNGELKKNTFDGNTTNFGDYNHELYEPLFKALKQVSAQIAVKGVQAFGGVRGVPVEFGPDIGLEVELDFGVNRTIYPNPHPTSDLDRYLVEDYLSIGLRLGVGLVVFGEGTLTKTFTLVYPARTYAEAQSGRYGVIDLLLPYRVAKWQLPNSFVLMAETAFDKGARVRPESYAPLEITPRVGVTRTLLSRIVIDAKSPERTIVHTDKSKFWKKFFNLELGVVDVIKLPLFSSSSVKDGELLGHSFLVESPFSTLKSILPNLVWADGVSTLPAVAKDITLTDEFLGTGVKFDLFGFFGIKRRFSQERIKASQDSKQISDVMRIERARSFQWHLLDQGAEQSSVIKTVLDEQKPITVANSVISSRFVYDDELTRSLDLMDAISIANAATLNSKLIDLDPMIHSRNQLWGHLQFTMKTQYFGAGLEALLALKAKDYWAHVAKKLNVSSDEFARLRSGYQRRLVSPAKNAQTLTQRYQNESRFDRVIYYGQIFLRQIEEAKRVTPTEQRIAYLVKALDALNFRGRTTMNPVLLAAAHEVIGLDNMCIDVSIKPTDSSENVLPGNKPIIRTAGNCDSRVDPKNEIVLFPLDGIELYNMFEWMKE